MNGLACGVPASRMCVYERNGALRAGAAAPTACGGMAGHSSKSAARPRCRRCRTKRSRAASSHQLEAPRRRCCGLLARAEHAGWDTTADGTHYHAGWDTVRRGARLGSGGCRSCVPQGALRLGCYGVWQEQLQVHECRTHATAHAHAHAHARACLPRVGKPERGREAHVFDARRAPARTASAHSLNGDAERRSTRARADQAGRSSRIPNAVRPIRQDVGFEYKPLRNAIAAVMGDLASSVVKVPREVITQRMQVHTARSERTKPQRQLAPRAACARAQHAPHGKAAPCESCTQRRAVRTTPTGPVPALPSFAHNEPGCAAFAFACAGGAVLVGGARVQVDRGGGGNRRAFHRVLGLLGKRARGSALPVSPRVPLVHQVLLDGAARHAVHDRPLRLV